MGMDLHASRRVRFLFTVFRLQQFPPHIFWPLHPYSVLSQRHFLIVNSGEHPSVGLYIDRIKVFHRFHPLQWVINIVCVIPSKQAGTEHAIPYLFSHTISIVNFRVGMCTTCWASLFYVSHRRAKNAREPPPIPTGGDAGEVKVCKE